MPPRQGGSARTLILLLWTTLVAAALYAYFFHSASLQAQLAALSGVSLYWRAGIYLVLACIRGFTLIPATYLLVAGLLVLPPLPLFVLTLAGIVVSSAAVYHFAGAMQLDRFFERRYPQQVARLRSLLARRELPIVIAWSFFPFAPTDVVVYVCSSLGVDLRKCLLGVAIGEGAICAVYVVAGNSALRWLLPG